MINRNNNIICVKVKITWYMQDDDLGKILCSVDIATEENLKNLVKVGEELLKKPVSRVNLETGIFEPAHQSTNEEALVRYIFDLLIARSLYNEMISLHHYH